jgi:hypothetical protein
VIGFLTVDADVADTPAVRFNEFLALDNPSDERVVASFFEQLRDMRLSCGIVRHDHKPRIDDEGDGNSNNRIRGSGEWKEDPEVVFWLSRRDRRIYQADFEVGKLRYGSKPEPMTLWFDAGIFRLTVLPPVIAVLEGGAQTRAEILEECQERFGLSARKTDEMLQEFRTYLSTSQQGHAKVYELNLDGRGSELEGDDDRPPIWLDVIKGSRRAG